MNLRKKYQPSKLSELIGRKARAEAVSLLKRDRFEALLIAEYGHGKTTLARLMTKARFCTGAAVETEARPCGVCKGCLFVEERWGIGEGPIGMAGGALTDEWFQVLDFTKVTPNDIKFIRRIAFEYGVFPRVYIFDELHRATKPTQDLLLKPLEDFPGSVIACVAKANLHKVDAALVERFYPLDLGKPDVEELVPWVRDIAEKEGIKIADASAPEELVEGVRCAPRNILTGLELVLVAENSVLSSASVTRIVERIYSLRQDDNGAGAVA